MINLIENISNNSQLLSKTIKNVTIASAFKLNETLSTKLCEHFYQNYIFNIFFKYIVFNQLFEI